MNSETLQYYFFTNSSHPLFKSIQRFFKYILKKDQVKLTNDSKISMDDILIVINDERENPELHDILLVKNFKNICIIGTDINCSINLLEFERLKADFKNLGTQKVSNSLFIDEEIINKIKQLFHSHGEDSLFEKLSKCQYFISNGIKLFSISELDKVAAIESFLKPGINNWILFKNKINKYSYYLLMCSENYEAKKINGYCDEIDALINDLDNFINNDSTSFEEGKLGKIIASLDKINEFLSKIYKDINYSDGEIQATYN